MPFGRELILRGAEERLAPILMTALVTALALLPVVMAGNTAGHEIEHPMAVVILGGLVHLDGAEPAAAAGVPTIRRGAAGHSSRRLTSGSCPYDCGLLRQPAAFNADVTVASSCGSHRLPTVRWRAARLARLLHSRGRHEFEHTRSGVGRRRAAARVAGAPAAAQQTESRIIGTVTDQNGGTLPGVTVTATSKSTGAVRTVVSDEMGRYVVTNLGPGAYQVSIELTGFAPKKQDVTLGVGDIRPVGVALEVAGAERVGHRCRRRRRSSTPAPPGSASTCRPRRSRTCR